MKKLSWILGFCLAVLLPAVAFSQAANPVIAVPGSVTAVQSSNGNQATVNGNNELRANIEGQGLCADTFDTAISASRWTTASAGGGVAPTEVPTTGGGITLGSGTTGNGYSYIVGKTPICGPFPPQPTGFLVYGFRIQLPAVLPANSYAFWGFTGDTIPASPTTTTPLNDGLGVELTTTGKLQFVSYQHGAGRVLIQDLSATGNNKQPLDGATYTWYQYFRGDKFYIALTDQDNIVATGTGAVGPNINTAFPIVMAIAGNTPPGSSLTVTVPAIFVGDNGHNSFAISDGLSAAIKATVKPVSTAPVTATDFAIVTALRPDSPGIIANAAPGTPNTTTVLSVQGETGMTPVLSTVDPCGSVNKSSVAISITSATTTSLVALSGTTTIYVCGFAVTIAPSATTADTFLIESGTGAACVTTQAALTGTFGNGEVPAANTTAPVQVSYGNGNATVFKTPASGVLCGVTAGTAVNVQGVLTYVQQ